MLQEEEDENAEADADMEEGKLQWAGGRGEAATYDPGDAEDAALRQAADVQEAGAQVGGAASRCRFDSAQQGFIFRRSTALE